MTLYYVATTGNDGASGSATTPWRTISQALNANLQPGDEIVVRAGTYNEALNINKGGSAAGDIILRSEVPGEAKLQATSGYNAISVNANYVTIDGFDIQGNGGDGIEANSVHHISILNNTVHDNGESGIQFNYSEFIRVEGNETYNNASDGWFSGISIYQNRNVSGDTTSEGFRTIIRNNVTHDNVTYSGEHTDGNGIIIDDFQSTQTSGYPNYIYPTLVEGNIAYGNGGKGIQVTWSDYVTVTGNTAYHNNVDMQNGGTWRGEISNAQSSNNTFVNNIAVADPEINSNNTAIDNNSYGGYSNDNVTWENNVVYNGRAGVLSVSNDGNNSVPTASDGNLIGVNPQFVNAAAGNFELASNSPAIDAGQSGANVSNIDNDGDARVSGQIDIGAQESGSAPVVQPTPVPTQPDVTPTPAPSEPVVTPEPTPAPDQQGSTFQLFDTTQTPQLAAESDVNSVELGMRFTADVDGSVSALRLYRGEGNTDTLPATLWDASGNKIATASFTDTGKAGWQEVALDSPVSLSAGEKYTVSYNAPNGGYAVTQGYFATAEDAGPVSVSKGAGVYQYGNDAALPTQSYDNSNYWIDVVLTEGAAVPQQDIAEPTPVALTPTAPAPVESAPVVDQDAAGDPIGAAGVVTIDQTDANNWHNVVFGATLQDASVVMGPMTLNDGTPATVLVRNVTDTGFDYRIAEWNYLDGVHGAEQISWLAIESGTHIMADGQVISAGSTSAGGYNTTVDFDAASFDFAPVVLTQAESVRRGVVATEQVHNVSADGFDVSLTQQESMQGQRVSGNVDWIAMSESASGIHTGTINGMTHTGGSADVSGHVSSDQFVFIADAQTTNGSDPTVLRTTSMTEDRVNFYLQEETSQDAEVLHTAEDIAFVAMDAGLIYTDSVFG